MNWRSTRGVVAVFFASALASACNVQQPSTDWNGAWKLNPSRSSFRGPIFTISISADGDYRYDDGRSSFTFRCDGKDRPIENNLTRACVKASATALDVTRKQNGVKTNAYHWELSSDAKVLTSTATAFSPSGSSVIAMQIVASRMSGSNDFAGQWQDESYLQRHADMTLRLDGQALHIGYPSAEQYIDAPFDGVYSVDHGPHAPEGMSHTARLVGKREIVTLAKSNGKVLIQGSLELSDDGRSITESWWNLDHPSSKATFVYEKK